MHYIKIATSILFCFFTITSFAQQKSGTSSSTQKSSSAKFTDPIEYNNYIIDMQTGVVDFFNSISSYIEQQAKDSSYSTLNDCKNYIAQCITQLKAMPDHKKNVAFRDAGVGLFQFYDGICKNEMKNMLDIFYTPNLTQTEVDKIQTISEKIAADEAKIEKVFFDAQDKFAKQFGFIIEKPTDANGQ